MVNRTVVGGNQIPMLRQSIPGNSWWGCAAWFPKSSPYFRPKKVIFQTRFHSGGLFFESLGNSSSPESWTRGVA